MRLNPTTKLQIVLGGAVTTNQLVWTVDYGDLDADRFTAEDADTAAGLTNDTTAVDMLAVADAGERREVGRVNVVNLDTAEAEVTIRRDYNGTARIERTVTLAAGDMLEYTRDGGWKVMNSAGAKRTTATASVSPGDPNQVYVTTAGGSAAWSDDLDLPGTLGVAGVSSFGAAVQVTGAGTPSSGAGVEIAYSASGFIRSFDRDTSTYKRLTLQYSFLNLGPNTGAGLVGINESENTGMTIGLTINQGANDDEILALKSSDVAHGMTGRTETDTYGRFAKAASATGGLQVEGFAGQTVGLQFLGYATLEDDAKNTGAGANIQLQARLKSGTSFGGHGTNANLVAIKDHNTTRFIFDVEGSAHADVEWTTFDRHDDLAVIEDMETLLAPSQVQRRFGEVVRHDADFFEREGILHDVRTVDDGRTRGMLNTTRALMLSMGAIRQVGGRVERLEAALARLPGGLEALAQIGA